MKFLPSKADPCIWLRKAPNLRCYEYIAVYVDDLCIAPESASAIILIFKSKYHLKVKGDCKLTYHLGADYFEDPDGTFVSQPKKYIDKLAPIKDLPVAKQWFKLASMVVVVVTALPSGSVMSSGKISWTLPYTEYVQSKS